jgi:hypothetical protein
VGGCKHLSPEFLFYEVVVVVVAFVQQLTDKELFAMGRSTTMVKEKRTQITVGERKTDRQKERQKEKTHHRNSSQKRKKMIGFRFATLGLLFNL